MTSDEVYGAVAGGIGEDLRVGVASGGDDGAARV